MISDFLPLVHPAVPWYHRGKRGDSVELIFHNRYGNQLDATSTHTYLLPRPPLRPYIAHYTLCLDTGFTPPGAGGLLTLIPDVSGCLVLELEDLPRSRLYGPTTEAVQVRNDLGRSPPRLFVEFRPGGLHALTGLPQWELRDQVYPLCNTAPALYDLARRALNTAIDLDGLVENLDRALCALPLSPSPVSPLLDYLAHSRESLPVRALAQETAYSQRHLTRLLQEGAGVGCKSFLRVLRVNAAVRALQAGPCSLTDLAQELGYYDQAHFIHHFRSVCGVAPAQYRASLSDFYNEPLKL